MRLRVGVVGTLDCRTAPEMTAFEEAVAQWAGAQRLVLTKRDIASVAEIGRARELAAAVNPLAELVDTEDRAAAVRAAFALRAGPILLLPPSGATISHPRIQVLLARLAPTLLWYELAQWLDDLAGRCGERLLRLKGFVRVADREEPILVQSVGSVFSAPRPLRTALENGPFLVLIMRDTDPTELIEIASRLPITITPLGAATALAAGEH